MWPTEAGIGALCFYYVLLHSQHILHMHIRMLHGYMQQLQVTARELVHAEDTMQPFGVQFHFAVHGIYDSTKCWKCRSPIP